MTYKLRIVYLAGGQCRIQKKHPFLTLGFWVTLTCNFGSEYWQGSESRAKEFITDYYLSKVNNRIIKYEEL